MKSQRYEGIKLNVGICIKSLFLAVQTKTISEFSNWNVVSNVSILGKQQPPSLNNEAHAEVPKTAVLQVSTWGSRSESIPTHLHVKMSNFTACLQPGTTKVLVSVAKVTLQDNWI